MNVREKEKEDEQNPPPIPKPKINIHLENGIHFATTTATTGGRAPTGEARCWLKGVRTWRGGERSKRRKKAQHAVDVVINVQVYKIPLMYGNMRGCLLQSDRPCEGNLPTTHSGRSLYKCYSKLQNLLNKLYKEYNNFCLLLELL